MKYCAQSHNEGKLFSHTFSADSWEEAEKIAKENGWELLGELVDEVACEDELAAMIEFRVTDPSVH